MQGHGSPLGRPPPSNPLAAMLMGMAGRGVGGNKGQRQGQEVDLKSRVAGMLDKERA